jgi:pimeloyl-ACP methyl ester carboxylesterase
VIGNRLNQGVKTDNRSPISPDGAGMRRALAILVILIVILLIAGVFSYRSSYQEPIDAVAKAEAELKIDLDSSMVPVGDIRLHVVQAGPADGPPLVLLHGYPEFWWGWRLLLPGLVKAGFRVIVPDQRGYNASDKPEGVEAYSREHQQQDILGLIETLGHESVNLAGHDMGAGVAWMIAIKHPEKVRKLIIFGVGHPLAYEEAKKTEAKQETVTWYRTFFQLPVIPEIVGRLGNWRLLVDNIRATGREGIFSDDEMDVYRYAWDRDNAMHYMLNWYRAFAASPNTIAGDGRVRMPTKIIWGYKDAYSESRLANLSASNCDKAEVVILPDAGHWLLHEEPSVITQMMVEFVNRKDG